MKHLDVPIAGNVLCTHEDHSMVMVFVMVDGEKAPAFDHEVLHCITKKALQYPVNREAHKVEAYKRTSQQAIRTLSSATP